MALEDQAKQLLQRRKYPEALELLNTCRATVCGPGPPSAAQGTAAHWTLVGLAQAALLLMQGRGTVLVLYDGLALVMKKGLHLCYVGLAFVLSRACIVTNAL